MRFGIKMLAMAIVGFSLFGCAKHNFKEKKEVLPSADAMLTVITKYNDLKLCQVTNSFFMEKLNVNPASHPNYNNDLRYYSLLENEISVRNINCHQIKNNAKPQSVVQLSPQQKRKQVLSICKNYVQIARYANPSVLFEMCIKGHQSTKEKCVSDLTKFNAEEKKLTGIARAEYIEVGTAFRTGCNIN